MIFSRYHWLVTKALLERRLISPWRDVDYKFLEGAALTGLTEADQHQIVYGLKNAKLIKLYWWEADGPEDGRYVEQRNEDTVNTEVSVRFLGKFWAYALVLALIQLVAALPFIPLKFIRHVEQHKWAYTLITGAVIVAMNLARLSHVGPDGINFRE